MKCKFCGIETKSKTHKCKQMLAQYPKETCEYCNKEVIIRSKTHSMQGHLRVCKAWKQKKQEILSKITKEFLIKEHHKNQKSLPLIAEELGLKKYFLLKDKCKEFKIEIQKRNHPNQVKGRIRKTRETCLEKYGYEDHLSCPVIIKKREETNLKRYGVKCVSQVPEINAKVHEARKPNKDKIYAKIRQTCLERYGVDHVWKIPEVIESMKQTKIKNGTITYASKSSQEFCWNLYNALPKEIQKHCYFHELNKEFGKYSNKTHGNSKYNSYDFVITDKYNICIEFNGDYWHANPKKYKAKDVLYNKFIAEDIWKKDKIKLNLIRSFGFDVIIVWESEVTDKTVQDILNYIDKH